MEFAYVPLPTLHTRLEIPSTSKMDDRLERHTPGLQGFILIALQLCPKLTLKQESRLSGAFMTRFHNLLFDSSWWYKVWSLLDLII